MAITTFLQGFVVRGASLRRRLDRGQTLDQFGVGGVGSTFRSIALTAAVLILVGALVLYAFGFSDLPAGGARIWASLFHSISAYNNAGFGLWNDSLEGYRTNRVVNAVIMLLIVLGGLGWRVTNDLWSNRQRLKRRNLSLHTRLVLRASAILIAGFAILSLSAFRINQELGMLTAITLVCALFADFLLLPALLMTVDKSKKSKSNEETSDVTIEEPIPATR